ncbi:DUF7033 domain-containing protein [Pedobacter nyackensis]|uniref:DUF7033 domain-containing protein n=1 Tax=Pedobacter nyackensis TaxID=475255 RepID=A0A1W2E647_9SPHI|nr:hypothetical protein [Pedobacter nyackensis]SMD05263.1 hypothetical protein SAMN04488101_110115 [Pedobacter nyackensis]
MKLLVYTPLLTPRIKYIFSFIFNDVLKTEIGFTTHVEEFAGSNLPKFSYAPQPIDTELFFKSTNLLLEHRVSRQHIKTTIFGETKVPFAVGNSTMPFDVFAASFYFLSRYEEYLHKTSKNYLHPYETSLQHQLKILKLPIIDSWALILKNILLKHFPSLWFGKRHFSFNPVYSSHPTTTIGKNLVAKTISTIKAFMVKKLTRHEEKIAGINMILADMKRFGFIQKPGFSIPNLQGKHHFDAKMKMPKSYIKLANTIAKNDYSMYYNDYPGFRAGTSIPFYWYDLQLEKKTQLLLHPVAATDIALLNNKTSQELLLQINELIDSVKLVNGDFYFLSLYNDIRPQ